MCNTATAKVARKVETKSIHVLLKKGSRKKRIFYGQADRKGCTPPSTPYGHLLVIFFGVCETLDYESVF